MADDTKPSCNGSGKARNEVRRKSVLRRVGSTRTIPKTREKNRQEQKDARTTRRSVLSGAAGSIVAGVIGIFGLSGQTGTARAQVEPDACTGPASNPEPGSPEWEQREAQNKTCAHQGSRDISTNPAYWSALGLSYPTNADRPFPLASRDPFRSKDDWDGERGRFDQTTFTDRDGNEQRMIIFRPLPECGPKSSDSKQCPDDVPEHVTRPPYPGVLIFDYVGNTKEVIGDAHFEQAQTLAEHGYMVGIGTYPAASGSGFDTAPDVLDFFLSTPDDPNQYGEYNPWWDDLDDDRVGLTGLSGNGRMALEIGFEDPRISAIVGWDPASSMNPDPVNPVPALIINGDYGVEPSEPSPPSGSENYEEWVELGYDAMQIVMRAGTHLDSARPVGCKVACSRYGGAIITYYTLAWFDRYLIGQRDGKMQQDARNRLMGSEFDDSFDESSIGMGRFDGEQAANEGDVLAGNQPIKLEGLPVEDRLSFYYKSRYHLDGGRYECEDMKDGDCPEPSPSADPPQQP